MSDHLVFRVQVLEGKGFGNDPQTLLCTAQFAGETKSTQYSVNTDAHIWNSTLSWSLSKDELRKAQASGSTHCKVSVLRKDGTRLGWLVVGLRSAKLQSQYRSDPQGQWLQLNATKLLDPPQLRISYSLCEERLLSQLEQPLGAPAAVTTAAGSLSAEASGSSNPGSRRVSSSSAAAASLRPSKSLSGRKRFSLSSAASDTGSLTAERDAAAEEEAAEAATESGDADRTMAAAPEPAAAVIVTDCQAAAEQKSPPTLAAGDSNSEPGAAQQQSPQRHLPQEPQQMHIQPGAEETTGPAASSPVGAVAAGEPVRSSMHVSTSPHLPTNQRNMPAEANTQSSAAAAPPSATTALEPERNATSQSSVSPSSEVKADPVAAAEASLPSFAQRRQQQQQMQLQQAKQRIQQDEQQQPNQSKQPQQQDQPEHFTQPAQLQGTGQQQLGQHSPQQNQESQQQRQQQAASIMSDMPQPVSAVVGGAADAQAASRSPARPDGPLQQTPAKASRQPAAAADSASDLADPVRQFVFTLDVRSFQAGRRLPVALASTYITGFLPQDFLAFLTTTCGAKIPPKLTPLRTLPAVDVLRGSEGALPNGCASVSFAAGVVGLAGLLAQEPRVVLEVWHKEKLRSDTLLGVASVSLATLLQECWVDGYAPVYALMTKAAGGQEQEEKVQVGLLRVVLSLEDKGPPPPTALAPPAAAALSPAADHSFRRSTSQHSPLTTPSRTQRALTPPKQIHAPAAGGPAAAAAVTARPYAQRQQQLQQGLAAAQTALSEPAKQQHACSPKRTHLAVVPAAQDEQAAAAAAGAGIALPPGDFRQMPEYLVAWELEVWKKAEEASFRAELKELEQQRMAVIEAQWWKRERAREADVAAIKAGYAKLEQQTKVLLAAVQDRESKLIAAEADLRRRQSDLERQQAARMSEAEAAVRRLQVECEHQLSLERDRTAAVARQRDAAEARLLAAEARAAAMEAQFTEYRAAQRDTPEAQLKVQLREAEAAAAAAEARASKAAKAKNHYKEQVLQLARELAALHQQRQQEMLQQHQKQQEEAKAREQSSVAAAQAAELSGLREQLAALRTAAMAAAAAGSPGHPRSPPSGDTSWHHHQQHHHPQRKHIQRHRHDKENDHRQHQQHGRGAHDEKQQRAGTKQQTWQACRPAEQHAAEGDVYSDDSEQQCSDSEVLEYASSADDDDDGSESGSGSEAADLAEQHSSSSSRRARLQHLQQQRRRQQQQAQQAVDKGAAGESAAADVALAEVAALAAILNEPRPGSAQVDIQQQQKQQHTSRPVEASKAAAPIHQLSSATAVGQRVPEAPSEPQQSSQPQHAPNISAQQLSPELDPLAEVRRLLKEKVELLASGLYGRDDAVILQIDARVQALAEQQLAG